MVTAQRTALVSEHAGTTTDPVIKSMELLPLGPIAVIDTAGLDDTGELGALRIERSKEMMDRTDLALLVIAADETADLSFEKEWLEELRARKTTVIGVMNQIDRLDAAEIEPRRAALEAASSARPASLRACEADVPLRSASRADCLAVSRASRARCSAACASAASWRASYS